MYLALAKIVRALAQGMALIGGALLLFIVGLTFISIVGRALLPLDIGIGPIRGIYDITEFVIAASIFSFLPWCQFERGHAVVDLFKSAFSNGINRLIDFVMDVAMLILAVLIAWRLYLGTVDKFYNGETTLIANLPVWQGFAAGLVGAVVFVLVAAFCVLRSARTVVSPAQAGA